MLIERAGVDDREAGRDAGGAIRVPAGTRSLELEYTAFSMAAPAKVRFKYRLRGFDREWRDAGARRTAFYGRLPPAGYTFEVFAANNDGIWSPAPAALRLVVEPLFWAATASSRAPCSWCLKASRRRLAT